MNLSDLITPSFAAGYAQNKSLSAFPELWDGLIGCWCPFMGPQVNTLLDFSGRKNHGVMTGFTNDSWVPGPRGWALKFTATAERIVCGTSLFRMTQSRTILGRVKATDFLSNTYAFYTNTINADTTKSYEMLLPRHSLNVNGLCWQSDLGPGNATFTQPDYDMIEDHWHYIGMARNGPGAITNTYQDGMLLDSRSVSNGFVNDTGQTFCIGSQNGAGNILKGAIDMLLLYDRQLRPELVEIICEGATPLHLAEHMIIGLESLAPAVAPTVTTVAITNITSTTATSGGTIVSDGGSPVIVKGICWNTTGTPTTADFTTADGSGNLPYVSLMTGLDPVTQYYVRAYATNLVGTGYGQEESFETAETPPPPPPTIKSVNFTSCGKLSCMECGGDVIICISPTKTESGLGFIEGKLVSTDGTLNNEYVYGFTYDAAQLADPSGMLISCDISGVVCKGCVTTYLDSLLDKYFQEIVIGEPE